MKITLHLEGNKIEIAEQCLEFVKTLSGTEGSATAAPAQKKTRGKKAAVVEDDEEEESVENSEDDEDTDNDTEESEDNSDESEDGEDIEDVEEEEKISDSDLKKVKAALRAYSDKHGKSKAVKILMKFAKSSAELKPDQVAKVIKALK